MTTTPNLVRDKSGKGVRGAQSFVRVFEACWARPSLVGLELLWRWTFGIPVLLLLWHEANIVLAQVPGVVPLVRNFTVLDPMRAATDIAAVVELLRPPVWQIARWLVPLLMVGWAIASGMGRSAVLRRYDRALHPRPATLVVLQFVRLVSLVATVYVWWTVLQWIAGDTVAGAEPNLVAYFAGAIVWSLSVFTAWALGSHLLSAAAMLAAIDGGGLWCSVRGAFALGRVRPKLLEINLVLGIVKLAIIVLSIALSSIPLPFITLMTGNAMNYWYAGCVVFYLVASDFFQVVRLVAFIEIWRAYRSGAPATLHAAPETAH
jgi:hypothetical protein